MGVIADMGESELIQPIVIFKKRGARAPNALN